MLRQNISQTCEHTLEKVALPFLLWKKKIYPQILADYAELTWKNLRNLWMNPARNGRTEKVKGSHRADSNTKVEENSFTTSR